MFPSLYGVFMDSWTIIPGVFWWVLF